MTDIEITIRLISGSHSIVNASRDEDLNSLRCKVGEAYDAPMSSVKLLLDGMSFEPQDNLKTLTSLGIDHGSELMFVRLPIVSIQAGMRLVVEGAGTECVNGLYGNKKEGEQLHASEHMFFPKLRKGEAAICDNDNQAIIWYAAGDGWPAGWYIVTGNRGHYFIASNDASLLPLNDWSIYKGPFCSPSEEPMPVITVGKFVSAD
mmetsp:Transcript_87989/g.138934  ORF Transcript_87989/g.138934 Transcript_87989/m.138934 type:complete len:204 (+) Transcript_87989:81-692(+)